MPKEEKEEEDEEQHNIDVDASLLYLLVIDVRSDINKINHYVVVINHYHNSCSRRQRLLPPLKLFVCLSFYVIYIRVVIYYIFYQKVFYL